MIMLSPHEVVCTCSITRQMAESFFGKCKHGEYPDMVTVATTYGLAEEGEAGVVHFATGLKLALRKTEIVTVH